MAAGILVGFVVTCTEFLYPLGLLSPTQRHKGLDLGKEDKYRLLNALDLLKIPGHERLILHHRLECLIAILEHRKFIVHFNGPEHSTDLDGLARPYQ